MRAADLIKKTREVINPPYSVRDVLISFGFLVLLAAIALTALYTKETRQPRGRAEVPVLDWVSTNGSFFQDSSGRRIILRGFVTITNTSTGPVSYTTADYARMKSWGANYQSIRIQAPNVGALPDIRVSSNYLQKLDQIVLLGKQSGMYSNFKLIVTNPLIFNWTNLWLNTNGEQEAWIAGWRNVWLRYKDEPAVIGYDLIGEPRKGKLTVSDEEFLANYVNPFYQKVIDEFRKVDTRHLAFFQPPLTNKYVPYTVLLDRPNVVYAPHFFPNILTYHTISYKTTMDRFVAEAAFNKAPLLIGEFGIPWNRADDGNTQKETDYQVTEKTALDLFNTAMASFSRPWFADDNARTSEELNWALIKGTSGISGPERKFIVDAAVQTYPQRIAGALNPFSYDAATKRFLLNYTLDNSRGQTSLFIPQSRHYPTGFTLKHSGGITLRFDPATPTTLIVVNNSGGIDKNKFVWDASSQILKISEWQQNVPVSLEINNQVPVDSDGDGFTDDLENYLGTNPLDSCSNTTAVNDEPIDAWPLDFDDDKDADIGDVITLFGVWGARKGEAKFSPRWDLNADGVINDSDTSFFSNNVGKRCI